MGKWEETQEAYHGQELAPEEKVIPERNKMGLVQALSRTGRESQNLKRAQGEKGYRLSPHR